MNKLKLEDIDVESFEIDSYTNSRGTVVGHATAERGICNWYAATHDGSFGCDNTAVPTGGAYTCGFGCQDTEFQMAGCGFGSLDGCSGDAVCSPTYNLRECISNSPDWCY